MLRISRANSIMFKNVNGLMMNFDNALSCETFEGIIGFSYEQKYYATDEIPIQLLADSAPTLMYYYADGSGSIEILSFVTEANADATADYYSYKLNQSKDGYLVATLTTETYISENIVIETELAIRVQWFNYEDAFGYRYRDDMVNFARFKGWLGNYAPAGTVTVFDNQEETVKIKEVIYRTVKLTIETVPPTVAELLTIAAAHDVFVVNDVEYVTEELPEVDQMGTSKYYKIQITLREKEAIGMNTHDTGYDPDDPSYYISTIGENYTDQSANKYTD